METLTDTVSCLKANDLALDSRPVGIPLGRAPGLVFDQSTEDKCEICQESVYFQ